MKGIANYLYRLPKATALEKARSWEAALSQMAAVAYTGYVSPSQKECCTRLLSTVSEAINQLEGDTNGT